MNASVKISARDMARSLEPSSRRHGVYTNGGKRFLDVTLILLSAPIVLPLVFLFILALLLTGARPFYIQDRVGRDGAVFRMIKFRTMCFDADAMLKRALARDPDLAEEWERDQKLTSDPRITALGKILRRTSLDELPQLWNVLRGEMSLVGPRPMTPEQMSIYPGIDYYAMRPGLSGPWQISARNSVAFAERARFDGVYHQKMSFRTDLKLILSTFRVVVRATGS